MLLAVALCEGESDAPQCSSTVERERCDTIIYSSDIHSGASLTSLVLLSYLAKRAAVKKYEILRQGHVNPFNPAVLVALTRD